MQLRARFIGVLIASAGLLMLFFLFAFWRSGFLAPVTPPMPEPMTPSMAFAFNPIVCLMPLLSLGAVGLIVVGIRQALDPDDR